jgi:hypothetical protein
MKIQNKLKQEYLISKGIDDFFTGISNAFHFFTDYFKAVISPPFEFAEIGRSLFMNYGKRSINMSDIYVRPLPMKG